MHKRKFDRFKVTRDISPTISGWLLVQYIERRRSCMWCTERCGRGTVTKTRRGRASHHGEVIKRSFASVPASFHHSTWTRSHKSVVVSGIAVRASDVRPGGAWVHHRGPRSSAGRRRLQTEVALSERQQFEPSR